MHRQVADRTVVPTHGEVFFDQCSTARAYLACVSGIHQHYLTPSFFRFGLNNTDELTPACIGYGLGKTMVLDHVLDIQVLKGNKPIGVDKVSGNLMMKIQSGVFDFSMADADNPLSFGSALATFLSPIHCSLSISKFVLCYSQESRVVHELFIGGYKKGLQPHVDAHRFVGMGKWLGFYHRREYGIPFASLTLDAQRFDLSFNRTMQLDFNAAYLGKLQSIAVELKPKLGIDEAVVAVSALKSRISRLLLASLYSAKERLERFVCSVQHILGHLAIHLFVFRTINLDDRKLRALCLKRDADMVLLPGFLPLLQSSIVEMSAKTQRLAKLLSLVIRGIHSVFERFQHLFPRLSLNVFANGLVGNIPRCGDKVAVSPHRGQLQKLWKLSPQIIRASALKCLNQLVYRQLGIAGHEKMKMVWLYLQRQYLHLLLSCHILKNGLQPILDAIHQYSASPLGTKDKVVVYEINLIARMFVFHVYSLSHFNTNVKSYRKENEPHSSPALKCGAF
jgi:hypothetical protein